MVKNGGRIEFEASLSSFRWKSWLLAMTAAVLLNCGLFLFLPLLMDPSQSGLDVDEYINNIQLIRLKKKETPPERKKEKPPEPPKEKPKPKKKVQTPKPQEMKKLNLPFKLNTRLPSVSADFQLQYADTIGYGPLGDASVDMDQLDEPLTPVARVPPVYPISARRKGVEGWVKVGFVVDEQGHVGTLQIIESEPPGVFDRSVIHCVSKWRYRPGTLEGVPVTVRVTKIIRFELE